MGIQGIYSRGEVYYVERYRSYSVGSEQHAGRPAVIVSNELNNRHSSTVEVVYLTTQPKKDMPTHVTVYCAGREGIALCEQIDTVAVERLGNFCGKCNEDEMSKIEEALMVSLGLSVPARDLFTTIPIIPDEDVEEVEVADEPAMEPEAEPATKAEGADLEVELAVTKAKLAMVQKMYNHLLSEALAAKGKE